MLGKGLESLIPPSKKPSNGDGNSGPTASDNNNVNSNASVSNGTRDERPYGHLIPKEVLREATPPEEMAVSKEEEVPEILLSEPEEDSFLPSPEEHAKEESMEEISRAAVHSKNRSREDAIFYLEVSKIHSNTQQPRRYFDEEAIRDLAASIREFGILQPIVVTKKEKDTPQGTEVEYELIAGERRLMAAKSLGMEHIPAIIRNVDLERERLELAIIENLQREDLNGIEMARAFARLQDEFRLTQREIASRLGKSRESVANTLRLLDLPTYIQEAIQKKEITESHGLFLLGVDDSAAQQALFHDLVNNKLTIRELKQKAKNLKKPETETIPANHEFKMFEEELSANLGAPVSIERRGTKGQITIKFYSEEELQALLNKLQSEEDL